MSTNGFRARLASLALLLPGLALAQPAAPATPQIDAPPLTAPHVMLPVAPPPEAEPPARLATPHRPAQAKAPPKDAADAGSSEVRPAAKPQP